MSRAGTLLSVNVGQPREVEWRGRTVRTAIWKEPVPGRVHVGRLNVAGDGQADLVGHGGEHRAVFVYQRQSYVHWERELGRALEDAGQFGENFTVDGLDDGEVCIGDRLRVGGAVFEVTQPRVTCFKVGIRLDEPRMPALLYAHGRPGFYLRVLEEGDVGAGDAIERVRRDPRALNVREASALLYLPGHERRELKRALEIDALPEGWRASYRALLEQDDRPSGNAGLAPPVAGLPAWRGFRPFVVERVVEETPAVRSLLLAPPDGAPLDAHLAGQFVTVRVPTADAAVVRSYSLSAPPDGRRLRISVKRDGRASALLHERVGEGDELGVAAPRGSFTVDARGDRPVVLLSAGIGVTPVLAMLGGLADAGSGRPVTWIHVARSRAEHAFAAEARALLARLPNQRSHIRYTRPRAGDARGRGFDAAGRPTLRDLVALDLPADGEAYLCGPPSFMEVMRTALAAAGLREERIHTEAFGPATTPTRGPHPPAAEPAEGFAVSFARSGLAVRWGPAQGTLLELAEACDVPVGWSCRTGVCHRCESGLVAGEVSYGPEPLDAPAPGYVLLCCARPAGDLTLDL
jgi:ferredoxin-NADP reductase/MOSC domain-containing protein YiiM